MARINIEDEYFTDVRWSALCSALGGDIDKALGCLTRLFIVAQKYWKKDRARIPKHVWEQQRLNPALLESGWAEWDQNSNGFFATESESQFEWLINAQISGKKGGDARRPSNPLGVTSKPMHEATRLPEINNLERSDPKAALSDLKPLPLTPPLPLTLIQNNKELIPSKPARLTSKKRGTDVPSAVCAGFETFWSNYPRKEHRTEALEQFAKNVGPTEYDAAATAAANYAAVVNHQKRPKDKIKLGSTFLHNRRWLDSLEVGLGDVITKQFEHERPTNHDAELAAIMGWQEAT